MPNIRPISDLRNHFNNISDTCHKEGEPVFITKNGKSDLVVMSHSLYEKQQALIELYQKLAVAETQSAYNAETKSHEEVMEELRRKINGTQVSD
ncbi:MAG TPA: type II toxin-antitoxin system Phd/YefM family antitoxin [Bacillales bacterium]|nr:type II toxin-antitoxin system Phd/YefM family antitoxin [Bacillales bacterium]